MVIPLTSILSIIVPSLKVATSAENLLSPLVDTSYPLSENLPHFISSSSGPASLVLEKNVSKAWWSAIPSSLVSEGFVTTIVLLGSTLTTIPLLVAI